MRSWIYWGVPVQRKNVKVWRSQLPVPFATTSRFRSVWFTVQHINRWHLKDHNVHLGHNWQVQLGPFNIHQGACQVQLGVDSTSPTVCTCQPPHAVEGPFRQEWILISRVQIQQPVNREWADQKRERVFTTEIIHLQEVLEKVILKRETNIKDLDLQFSEAAANEAEAFCRIQETKVALEKEQESQEEEEIHVFTKQYGPV